MTVAELLEQAKIVQAIGKTLSDTQLRTFAGAVIDLLGEAAPCGWPEPEARAGIIGVPNEWAADWINTTDGRALGRMIFRACDEADDIEPGATT